MATNTCIKNENGLQPPFHDNGPVAPANCSPSTTSPCCDSAANCLRSAAGAENPPSPEQTRFTEKEGEQLSVVPRYQWASFDLLRLNERDSEVLGESLQLLVNELSSVQGDHHDPSNPYSVLSEDDDSCSRRRDLGGKAKTLCKWFKSNGLSLISDPPAEIECGKLRSAVRQCFHVDDPAWELSFKTVAKIEKNCCKYCLPSFEAKLNQWKEARFAHQAVDEDHLSRFRKMISLNIDNGWDRARRPFIPNGNGTLHYRRKDGGNWNREEFSDECRVELVFSSGKPRVVTMYSSENTRILAPLHYSLYDSLKRSGWLLVGDPTDRHVRQLNGADFLSFDYQSATDNIKTVYVRAAIEELKKKADHLSDDERRALDVLGNLKIDGREAVSGQPMGSVFSFPLLCLINKTVVDLAMTRLLEGKEISFKEWSGHRCLVNGDDLLVREVRKTTNLREHIIREGGAVGLVVNQEKTMISSSACEINSTLFIECKKQHKFNASSLWMDAGVEDVLGFARESTSDSVSFRKVVRRNAWILAKQSDKHLDELPPALQMVCRKDKKIRKAITSLPANVRPIEQGVISMVLRPENYELSKDEEHAAMRDEIERVREAGIHWGLKRATKDKWRTTAIPNAMSFSSVLKKKRDVGQELIPACYLRCFRNKVGDALVEEEVACLPPEPVIVGDGSRISVLLDYLRAFNHTRKADRTPGTWEAKADYVSLVC